MAATNNTPDLLGVFNSIEVRNEEKISQQDIQFCKKQQETLKQSLLQLDEWYAIFKKSLPNYAHTWKVNFQSNGTVKTTKIYDGLTEEFQDYNQYAFTPFEAINDLVEKRRRSLEKFAGNIIQYFNNNYKLTVPTPEFDKENLSVTFQPDYMTYVDSVIAHLGGRGFRETAEDELIDRLHQTVLLYDSRNLPELKAKSIIFRDLFRFYQQSGKYKIDWSNEKYISHLCSGLAFYAHERLNGDSKIIYDYDRDNVDIAGWYNLSTSPAEQMKFYKNGRVDVKFKDTASAEECFNKLKLNEL